jgi:hypothetical protein
MPNHWRHKVRWYLQSELAIDVIVAGAGAFAIYALARLVGAH